MDTQVLRAFKIFTWYFSTTTVLAPATPTTPRVASNSEWKSEREPLRVFVVASQTFMLGWSGPVSHEWDSFMLHSSAVCVSWLCDLLDKPLQAILCGYHQVFSGGSSVSWALHIVDYYKPPCRCIWQKMTKELSNKNHPKPFLKGTPSRIKFVFRSTEVAKCRCFLLFNEASSPITWYHFHILPDLHHVSVGHK